MGTVIVWNEYAKSKLEIVFEFYIPFVGAFKAMLIVDNIIESSVQLEDFPEMGRIEELLLHKEREYRYLISKNHKIIYWYNKSQNQVEIVDVFDTRQNPKKLID